LGAAGINPFGGLAAPRCGSDDVVSRFVLRRSTGRGDGPLKIESSKEVVDPAPSFGNAASTADPGPELG
jgi:hypothetical protein